MSVISFRYYRLAMGASPFGCRRRDRAPRRTAGDSTSEPVAGPVAGPEAELRSF